jgi:hypothetical protein
MLAVTTSESDLSNPDRFVPSPLVRTGINVVGSEDFDLVPQQSLVRRELRMIIRHDQQYWKVYCAAIRSTIVKDVFGECILQFFQPDVPSYYVVLLMMMTGITIK